MDKFPKKNSLQLQVTVKFEPIRSYVRSRIPAGSKKIEILSF